MENKYFNPDIEDLCIGYECEIWMPQNPDFDKWDWESFTLEKNHFDHEQPFFPLIAKLRVLYLTKEQIEAEGWSFETVLFADDDENDVYSDGFAKHIDQDHWYEIVLRKDNKIHIVYKWYRNSVTQLWRDVYYGECKDINTFRKLIKLLGI